MDKKICLDSDIIIEILKNNKKTIEIIASSAEILCITPVTIFEIWNGRFEKETQTIKSLLKNFEIIDFDADSSFIAGDIERALKNKGEELEIRDIFIASVCISNKMPLLTNNKKHFERLKDFGLHLS